MTTGEVLSICGVALAVLTAASTLLMFVVRLMLDARFGPLQKSLDALTDELRGDMKRIDEAVKGHGARIDSLTDRVSKLDADKVSHGRLDAVLGRREG